MVEKRIGVCNLCEAICGLELTIDDGVVTSVRGNDADPLSRGHICPKGVAIADVYTDPDRLRRPVKRVGDDWVEIGWDEAFDLVADNLARIIGEHGRDSLGFYLGNPNVHSLGSMTHGIGMVKALRSRNTFSATSVDQLPHQLLAHLMFGHQLLLPIPDIDRTSYFLVFGANPMASNGSLMTAPDFPNRLRELKRRGGQMVVFDPRRTETAKVSTEHHFVRPGADAWVLLAMLNVLFADGIATPPSYADRLGAVEDALRDFTPERAAAMSGVPADEIVRVARDFADAESAVAYGRVGVSTHEFGSVCQWAVNLLNILTGNFDRIGGAMFTSPAIDAVGTGLIGRGHHGAWHSRVRGLPETAGELPVAVLSEEIETPGPGQIRAMLTLSGNPVLSTPDGVRLDGALASLDFMAAVDIYVNETTRHADVILPPNDGARARPLRPDLPDLRGAQHGTVHTGRVRQGQGRPPRLADLPRDRPAHDQATAHQAVPAQPRPPVRTHEHQSHPSGRAAAAAHAHRRHSQEAARPPRGHRPRPTAARVDA
ncbi:molybdopterin-dependent oxidoreductase [Nocardioides sp. InS609-2]|uniref:molybdopterin-dependent oxidoreductase n=1 Tax=Nocardioides sp. InS609-2 TaxID=2760705 RepID=UPI0020BEA909|nr:molybdopterin-dependent oxidoreductase [Nocardioides sp. InS609-2]